MRIRFIAGLLAVLCSVFILPYLFPPSVGVSAAYLVGFNNRASVVALLAGSLLFAIWGKGFGFQLHRILPRADYRPFRKSIHLPVLISLLLVTAALCFKLFLHSRRNAPMFEALYFLDRYNMHATGGRLFRDFQFDYGPLLFYPAIWWQHLTHRGIAGAYFGTWILQWLLGIGSIWLVLSSLGADRNNRTVVFVLSSLVWMIAIVDGGSNYTPLRFMIGSIAALLVYRTRRKEPWAAAAVATLSFLILFLYSVEQGVVFAAGTLLYFGLCARDRNMLLPLSAFAITCCGIVAVGKQHGLLNGFLMFGGGDYNIPLLISPSTVCLIVGMVMSACLVVSAFRNDEARRPELYLVALAVAAAPAALGRADPGHVFINALPALIVVSLALLEHSPSARTLTVATWCVYLQGAYILHYAPLERELRRSPPDANLTAAHDFAAQLHRISAPGWHAFAPFGFPAQMDIPGRSEIRTGLFFGYGFGTMSRGLPEAKIAELQAMPGVILVLPQDYIARCNVGSPANFLDSLFKPVFEPKEKHTTTIGQALCTYVNTHYGPMHSSAQNHFYALVKPIAKGEPDLQSQSAFGTSEEQTPVPQSGLSAEKR